MHNPQKVTVIGGSGFIGTRLCQTLAERQVDFEIVDLKPSGRFPKLTRIADIRDLDALRLAVSGDVIIHLAAVHRDDISDPRDYETTNVDGTKNVCKVAAEKEINRIVFTSSVAVYGFAPPDTDESGAINPFNEYGRTKYAAEEALNAWYEKASDTRNLAIIRPTVVFGEGNRGNVFQLLNQIAKGRFVMVGSGRNVKSMAYVGNIAAFLDRVSQHDESHIVVNYIDKPDYDMNKLVSQVRERLLFKSGVGLRLPYWLGIVLGKLADVVVRLTGKKLPVSSIRVRKFCGTTQFRSSHPFDQSFDRPNWLEDALKRTLEAEFINPDPNREVFFTE